MTCCSGPPECFRCGQPIVGAPRLDLATGQAQCARCTYLRREVEAARAKLQREQEFYGVGGIDYLLGPPCNHPECLESFRNDKEPNCIRRLDIPEK